MIYRLIRKLLFKLDAEKSHDITLQSLHIAHTLRLTRLFSQYKMPRKVMGFTFPNPLGLAAGLDKNADHIESLAALGFGFIEIGTVTPKPQDGNPKPRLFRLPEHQAIINRMGFNNKGLDHVVAQLKKSNYRGILGVNIGKNKDTPNENALDDYLLGFRSVAPYASYITLNISSPNTPGLRELQQGDALRTLLKSLKQEQAMYQDFHSKYVPLVVKIAPDLTSDELKNIANILLEEKLDGVIATNTTISRDGVESSPFANEAGGLSGKPLTTRSTEIIRQLSQLLDNQIPIIGCGGIFSPEDAKEKMLAGASLVQVYTGLIYEGPGLIKRIITKIRNELPIETV